MNNLSKGTTNINLQASKCQLCYSNTLVGDNSNPILRTPSVIYTLGRKMHDWNPVPSDAK